MVCTVCSGVRGVSEMTDGRSRACLCDDCRQAVVLFFHVYKNLDAAVREARTARVGATGGSR